MLYEVRCEIYRDAEDDVTVCDTALVLYNRQYAYFTSAIEAAKQYVRNFGLVQLLEAEREGWRGEGRPRAYVGSLDEDGVWEPLWMMWADEEGDLQEFAQRARSAAS